MHPDPYVSSNAPHLAQVESRVPPCSILLSREGGSQRETHFHFKLDFQKVDQQTGGKWLIHGTKYHKDNLSPSLELSCRKS